MCTCLCCSNFFNNIIVDALSGSYNSGGMLTWGKVVNGSAAYQAMRDVNWNTGLYAERYPDLAVLEDFFSPNCAQDVNCPGVPPGALLGH